MGGSATLDACVVQRTIVLKTVETLIEARLVSL